MDRITDSQYLEWRDVYGEFLWLMYEEIGNIKLPVPEFNQFCFYIYQNSSKKIDRYNHLEIENN